MLGRTFLVVCLLSWPALLSAQIIIDGGGDEPEGTAPEAPAPGAQPEAAAPAKGQAPQEEAASGIVIVPLVSAEAATGDESEAESGGQAEPEPEPEPEPLDLGVVRQAVEEQLRTRLTQCVSQVARPKQHGLSGTFVASAATGGLVVRPSKLTFSDEMFRAETESAKQPAVKKAVATRRAEFKECLAETTVELEGRLPVSELTLDASLVWFSEAAILRDVSWREVAVAPTIRGD